MKIKRADIDAAIAKEVMGWHVEHIRDCQYNYCESNDRGMYDIDDWEPSTDANHALEAWRHRKSKNKDWIFSMYDSVDIGPCVDISNSDGMSAMDCTDESITIAICLALLSAVRGEQVELEN